MIYKNDKIFINNILKYVISFKVNCGDGLNSHCYNQNDKKYCVSISCN